jgi:hypothetical protein
MAPRWLGPLLAAPLALGLSVVSPQPARALVPYVYVPGSAQLEGAGLGIAQVAARLLRLGQVEDAARLAALTVRLLPKDPRGWVLLAEAQLRNKQIKNAATSLARAKQLDPQNSGRIPGPAGRPAQGCHRPAAAGDQAGCKERRCLLRSRQRPHPAGRADPGSRLL